MKPKLYTMLLTMLDGWINFIRQERPGWLLKFDPKWIFKGCMTFYKVLEKAKMRFFTNMGHNSYLCKPPAIIWILKAENSALSSHILPQIRTLLVRNTP